jgi:membrane-bound ClpP family serine protease
VLVFLSIFIVGFAVLVISMIFGHDTGDGFDHDLGGDAGVDADHGGPNIFSVRMISLLLVGFGGGGFGVRATSDASMLVASMAGLGGAAVVGVIGYVIIRMFYSSQASSTITDRDIIGCTANLIDGISGTGNGQISCVLRGREITYLARSRGGESIPRGTPVRVVGKSGNIVTVEPVE